MIDNKHKHFLHNFIYMMCIIILQFLCLKEIKIKIDNSQFFDLSSLFKKCCELRPQQTVPAFGHKKYILRGWSLN